VGRRILLLALGVAGFGNCGSGIAKTPQPDQSAWALLFRFLPLGPIFLTLAYAVFQVTRGRWSRGLALRCARILLIGGIILVAIATPKP
jgi:hypothetical protein